MPYHWGEDDTDEEEGQGERGEEGWERSETGAVVLQAQKVGKEMAEPCRARASDQGLGRLGRVEEREGQTMLSRKLTERLEKQGLGGFLDTSHAQQTLNLNHKLNPKLGSNLNTSYAQRPPARSPHVRFARETDEKRARAGEPDLDSADVSHDREAAEELRSLVALSRIKEIASMVRSASNENADGQDWEAVKEHQGSVSGVEKDDEEATYLAQVLDLSYSEAFQTDSSSSRAAAAAAAGANEAGGRDWSGQSEPSRNKGMATTGYHGQHRRREDARALGRDADCDGRGDQWSGRERDREGEGGREGERELNGPRASDGDGHERDRDGGVIVQRLRRLGGGQGDLNDSDRGVWRTRVVAAHAAPGHGHTASRTASTEREQEKEKESLLGPIIGNKGSRASPAGTSSASTTGQGAPALRVDDDGWIRCGS